MPMDKSMLDKMQMPKKAGEDDEMLTMEEGDMENEGEAKASGMDLSALTDEELMEEMKKRGLMPGSEAPEMEEESEMEMED